MNRTDPDSDTLQLRLLTVQGLDLPRGLRSSSGGWESYLQLLRTFAAHHGDDGIAIQRAVENGDSVTAERLATTLHCISAALGLMSIDARAATLVNGLRARVPQQQLLRDVTALDSTIATVIDDINTCLPRPSVAAGQLDSRVLERRLQEMRALLLADEFSARAFFQQLQTELPAGPADGLWAQLGRRIEGFDYPAAIPLLDRLLDERGA